MDITNIDANVWQYLFTFIEHNKIFTLILICIAAIFWLFIKKIIAFPCNFFTGKVNNTKMMLAEWQKDICSFSNESHKFAEDHAKNLLFNRLAEKIITAYYLWKRIDHRKLKTGKLSLETLSSAEYQLTKLEEIRKKWKLEFTAWCKLQKIPENKIKHIIRVYEKLASGEIKALKLMITRLSGNYDYINLLFYAMLNAIEFDLEEAANSFNGDLVGLNIEGYTIKGSHKDGNEKD